MNFISLTDLHVYTWVLWLLPLSELHFPDGLSCLYLGTLVAAVKWNSFPWQTIMFTLGYFGCFCYVNFISLTDVHVYIWVLWLLLLSELHFPDGLSCLHLGTLVAAVMWTSFPWRTFMFTLGYFGSCCYVNFISLTDLHVYNWVLWMMLLCELHFPDRPSCLHLGT